MSVENVRRTIKYFDEGNEFNLSN